MDLRELREELAALEHEQWEYWSKEVAKGLQILIDALAHDPSQGNAMDVRFALVSLLEKWEKSRVPYADLPEDVKEHDRKWANRVIAILALSEDLE